MDVVSQFGRRQRARFLSPQRGPKKKKKNQGLFLIRACHGAFCRAPVLQEAGWLVRLPSCAFHRRLRPWFVLLYMSLFYDSEMKAKDPQMQLWHFWGGTFNRSGVLPEEWEQYADLF